MPNPSWDVYTAVVLRLYRGRAEQPDTIITV